MYEKKTLGINRVNSLCKMQVQNILRVLIFKRQYDYLLFVKFVLVI